MVPIVRLFGTAFPASSAPAAFPELHSTMWLGVSVACLAGLVLGDIAASFVPTRAAQILLIVLAFLGGAATIVRGVLDAVA